jgi:hypothetical protein
LSELQRQRLRETFFRLCEIVLFARGCFHARITLLNFEALIVVPNFFLLLQSLTLGRSHCNRLCPAGSLRLAAFSPTTPRREVIPVIRKLHNVLIFNSRPVLMDRTQFNAQLLEQRREDIFLAMHQMGLLR